MIIKINLKIFIFIIFFYFTKQINIYFCLMLFALIHEMGHLLSGILLGLIPKSLTIMPLGVCINFKVTNTKNINTKKLFIAMAGPVTNILIIVITYIFKFNFLHMPYESIIYSNLLICIFNLIPIYPLDGGRILKNILHIKYGMRQSVILTNKTSNIIIILITILSSLLIYYLQNIAVLFILIYLWGMVLSENKKFNLKKRVFDLLDKNY